MEYIVILWYTVSVHKKLLNHTFLMGRKILKRAILLDDISDGRLYKSGDTVNLDADGCSGCSYCCREMTDTIILDPWDIYMLSLGVGNTGNDISLAPLLAKGFVSLSVFEGLTLPRLSAKTGADFSSCVFLEETGRCRVHAYRPGFCRLFPLGRIYEDEGFHYFLQSRECRKEERKGVRIDKWLGIDNLEKYEDFILKWHEIQENIKEYLKGCDDENAGKINMMLLKLFYLAPYDAGRDFYLQFEERRKRLLND